MNAARLNVLSLITALLIPMSGAAAVIIDFDGAAPGIFNQVDYLEDGYVMTNPVGHYHIENLVHGNGTNAVTIDAVGATDDQITFAQAGGGLFDLLSLDVLDTGDEENGGILTASNGSSMALGTPALGHNIFGVAWQELTWITLTISDSNEEWATIDNIELEVPAPAPFVLLGVGLLGLCAQRRSRS